METGAFFAGIIFTLFVEFIGYKIYQARERRKARDACRKARDAYISPSGPQTPRDFPDSDHQQQ